MNKSRIDSIILEVLNEFKQPITESVINWSEVKDLLSANNIHLFNYNGVETAEINDPEFGTIYLNSKGEAFIQSTGTTKSWIYNANKSTISIDNKVLSSIEKPYQTNIDVVSREKYIKSKSARDSTQALDIFQTTLDWLGLIPGFGDVLDVINAIIYFARGRQVEGFLSLIAVIPMAGSAIKLGVKGTMQALGSSFSLARVLKKANLGDTKDLIKFYETAIQTGKISKLQLKQLANYGDEIANLLVSSRSKIASISSKMSSDPNTAKAVYKQIDEMAVLVRRLTSDSANAAVNSGKKSNVIVKGLKAIGNATGGVVKKVTFGSLNLVTFGGFGIAKNLIKKLGFGPRELNQLRKAMDARFVKQVEKSSVLTTALFKQMKSPSAATAVGQFGIPPWLYAKKTKDIDAWFDNLKKTDPLKWKQVSNNIAKYSMNIENPYYVKMASNYFQQAGNAFRPGAVFSANKGDILSSLGKLDTYRFSNPKNLDIVYNEIEDLGEKLGLDPEDNANGIILSALYLSVMELVKNNQDMIPGLAAGAAVVGTVTDMTGLTDFGTSADDAEKSIPGGEVIEVSSELVQIKDDFKQSNGTTTERLDALAQQGYTPEEIMQLKRELDID